MIKVKLTTNFPHWPLEKQTPNLDGVWGNYKFYINENIDECDFWVIFDGFLSTKKSTKCAPENTVLLLEEPPCKRNYRKGYINQFGRIFTYRKDIKHKNIVNAQPMFPWMIGGRYDTKEKKWKKVFSKDYTELKNINEYKKTKLISVIASTKNHTEGLKKRLKFVDTLKEHFEDKIDVFGRGINTFEDKWNVLAPYKYHITLENSFHKDHWSEKIADCFLSGTYPIYYGCPNIHDYFGKKSLTTIDIDKPEKAIRIIEEVIAQDTYEKTKDELMISKDKVLDEYQLFPMLCKLLGEKNNKNKKIINLKQEKRFFTAKEICEKIINKITTKLNMR